MARSTRLASLAACDSVVTPDWMMANSSPPSRATANGVEVQRQRIRASANLADGDHIRIGDHEFIFEIGPR